MSSILFQGSQFTSPSLLELQELPEILRPLLNGVHEVQGFNVTFDIGHNSREGGTCIVIPQSNDYRVYFIDDVQGSFELLSGDRLMAMAKRQYPELFQDIGLRQLIEIGPDSSSNHHFYVMKDLSRSHPSEEITIPCSQTLEKEKTSHPTEKFLSPANYATSNNSNLSPSRKNVISDRVNESEFREVNQPFKKEQENELVEDTLIDGAPVSVHGASSAKQNYSNLVHSKNSLSRIGIEDKEGESHLSRNVSFSLKRKPSPTWGRLRSVSESDAVDYDSEEDELQSDSEQRGSLDVTRSLPSTLKLASGIKPARNWDIDKSEIVIPEVKKPIDEDDKKVTDELDSIEGNTSNKSPKEQLGRKHEAIEEDRSKVLAQHTVLSAPNSTAVKSIPNSRLTRSETDLSGKPSFVNLPETKFSSSSVNHTCQAARTEVKSEMVVPQWTEALEKASPDRLQHTDKETTPKEKQSTDPNSCQSTVAAIPPCSSNDEEKSSLSGDSNALSDYVVAKPSGQLSPKCSLSHGLQLVEQESQVSLDRIIENVSTGSRENTKTLLISVSFQCKEESKSDESFCCQAHDHQWCQDVLNRVQKSLSSDMAIGKSEIRVIKNRADVNTGLQFPRDSLEDYTPGSSIFSQPIDCRSRNNQPCSPAMPGAISSVASCPTRPKQNRAPISGQASSVPANAPQAVACIDHMKETLEPQTSYMHLLSLQGGANNKLRNHANGRNAIQEEDSSSFDQHSVDFVPASEAKPSHQALVYPKSPHEIQRLNSDGNYGNGLPVIAGNVLIAKGPEVFSEENKAVAVDNPGVCADKVLQGAAKNKENMDDNKNTFLPIGHFADIKPGTVVYSTDLIPLIEGQSCVQFLSPTQHNILGRGGNGIVFECLIQGKIFAVKETAYRCGELNAWQKLNHPHLIRLLALGMGPVYRGSLNRVCYQFMPLMSGSIRDCMQGSESLRELSEKSGLPLQSISYNVLYISECTLEALDYLAIRNMQHHDVKGSNILVRKICSCPDIWSCNCPWKEGKFLVMLADLDSIKETKETIRPRSLPCVTCRVKTQEELRHGAGTVGIHAPEQLLVPTESSTCYNKTVVGGPWEVVENNFCGWWCDGWSFGRMIVILFEGRNDLAKDRIHCANILLKQLTAPRTYTPHNEDVVAFVALSDFLGTANEHNSSYLSMVASLAKLCMNPDFKSRLSPSELLTWLADKGLT